MTNDAYVIYITTTGGLKWIYRKEKDSWTQTTPAGKVRKMTAEQLLSHLLPPLAKDQPALTVEIKRIE